MGSEPQITTVWIVLLLTAVAVFLFYTVPVSMLADRLAAAF